MLQCMCMLYTMYWWVMMMMKKSLFTKAHVCCEIMYVMPTRFLLYHDTLLYDFYRHFDTCGTRAVFFSLSLCARWHRCAIPISSTRTTTHIPETRHSDTYSDTCRDDRKKGWHTAEVYDGKRKNLDNRVARSLHICLYIKLCVYVKRPMFHNWGNTVISALYCAAYLRRRERAYRHPKDTTIGHNNKHAHRRAMRSLCPLSLGPRMAESPKAI